MKRQTRDHRYRTRRAPERGVLRGIHRDRVLVAMLGVGGVVFALVAFAGASSPSLTPTAVRVAKPAPSSLGLHWKPVAKRKIAGYDLFRDGVYVGRSKTRSFRFTNLMCATSFELGVAAVTADGTRSDRVLVTGTTRRCAGRDRTPPSAPGRLHATTVSPSQVVLRWNRRPKAKGLAGFEIWQRTVASSAGRAAYGSGDVLAGAVRLRLTTRPVVRVSGLACGITATFAVNAYDVAGNRSPQSRASVTTPACAGGEDTTAPSAPGDLRLSRPSPTGLAATWRPSTDAVGVSGYEVWLDGARVSLTRATSIARTGLACGAAHTVGVVAFDAAGNRSARTNASIRARTDGCPSARTTQAPPVPTPDAAAPGGSGSAAAGPAPTTGTGGGAAAPPAGSASATGPVGSTPAAPPAPTAPASSTPEPEPTVSGDVVELSGTVSPGTVLSAVRRVSGAVTVRPAGGASSFTVAGSLDLDRGNVAIVGAAVQGKITFLPGANGSSFVNGSANAFAIYGADDVTIQGSTFDGQGVVPSNQVWDQPAGNTPDRFRIVGNTIRNYYVGADPSNHSEGIFVGYATDGLIEANSFQNNGNTAHVFFSYWGARADPGGSYPRNVCVRGNTFGATRGAYFAVDIRLEIPASTGIAVDPSSNRVSSIGLASQGYIVRGC